MLSPQAEKLINQYFNLPFHGIDGVRCPYFNNAKLRQRAQLRVLTGKGTPEEIIEEAKIISVQYHAGLFEKSGNCCLLHEHNGTPVTAEDLRRFLIDNNLGIECSGFATHVLRAHYHETKKFDLVKKFFIVSPKKFFRWILSKLRPIENISVRRYADDRNTKKIFSGRESINYKLIQPADVLVLLETGPNNKRNHIIVITDCDKNKIYYVHARAWSSEGRYSHGVARGEIKITKPNASLLEQEWTELGKTGAENETYLEAKNAHTLEIRRVKF